MTITSSLRLRGVIPPVVTPLDPDLEVDVGSLERLVGFLLEGGVDGLFILGSTSEAAFLPERHRELVVEVVSAVVSGQVPILVGGIDMTTMRVIDQAERAGKAGCAGLVATAPFYARTHPAEIARHYRMLAEFSPVPVYAYDVPVSVHSRLDRGLILDLASEGVLAGLKDSSGDMDGLRQLLAMRRDLDRHLDAFSVFTGSEVTVDFALRAGAEGAVPGLANVDPRGYSNLYRLCRSGDWSAAEAEQERLLRLFAMVGVGNSSRMGPSSSSIGAFKAALHLKGVIDCPVTAPPQIPLDAHEVEAVRAILERSGGA